MQPPLPMLVCAGTTREIVACNTSAAELCARPVGGLLGRGWTELGDALGRDELAALAEGECRRAAWTLERPDGSTVACELSSRPVPETDLVGISVRDVSELDAAQRELRVFAEIAEATRKGVVIADVDGHIEWANPALLRAYGYTLDELRGQNAIELFAVPETDPAVVAHTREVTREGRGLSGIYQTLTKDGRRRRVSADLRFVDDGKGGRKAVAIETDLSDLDAALRQVEASERRFRAAITGTLDAVYLLDACYEHGEVVDFELVEVNARSLVELGMRREELVGGRICELFPINREAGFFEQYKRVFETGELLVQEYRIPDGQPGAGWFRHQVVPLDTGVAIFNRDISEQRAVEEELREREHRLREAQAIAALVDFELELDSGVVARPGRLADFLGLEVEEVEDWAALARHVHSEDRAEFEALRERFADADVGLTSLDLRFAGPREGPRHLQLRLREREHDPGGHRVLQGTVQDITARKREEQARRELEQALTDQQLEESIGLLAGRVAHDFNNMLLGIVANVELAAPLAESEPEIRESLDEIMLVARRMGDLTNELLDYGCHQPRSDESVDLVPLVREVVSMARPLLRPRTTLRLDLPEGPGPVRGNSTRLRQIVMNLVINAADAVEDRGGTIEVSVRKLDADAGDSMVLLTVRDDGRGMSEATQARIFEPFFTTKAGGRGLGLAAARRTIESVGGRIRVESELGVGTTFRVWLEPPVSVSVAARERVDLRGCKLLLADDEDMVRAALERGLGRLGAEVTAVSSGEQLVEGLDRAVDFDAVIIDWVMPGLAGEELLAAIRARRPALPVLVVSGFLDDPELAMAADGFVQKPFGIPEFADAIATLLEAARSRAS